MCSAVANVTHLRIIGVEDITHHFPKTFHIWREQFHARADRIRGLGFDERFMRMWDYYLAFCEGGFTEERIGNVQMVLKKPV